jgi:hypothetical protein
LAAAIVLQAVKDASSCDALKALDACAWLTERGGEFEKSTDWPGAGAQLLTSGNIRRQEKRLAGGWRRA